MIIRKPYAFLIKNFRKVHIFLLILSLYVLFKLFGISSFINEFMSLGVYDYYNDPISKHITIILYVVIFILLIVSFFLLLLLKRKDKPWKIYLVPIIEYISLFLILGMISNFFKGYTNDVATTDLRLSRDLLFMLIIGNLVTIGVYFVRVLGIDLNKFNFTQNQEFLELSEEDREEVEIRIKFDKNIFIRFFNRVVRNLNYFYLEHKNFCKTVAVILCIVLFGWVFKLVFITNKVYSEGDFYNANGYTIKINQSYFTDKAGNGEIISKNSNFIIVDLTIKNNDQPRTIKLDNFHLKSGVSDFTTTGTNYEKEFSDLGKTYDSVTKLAKGETVNTIIVFKVDRNLRKNSFALFYQENEGILRKIKLKITDVSKIEDKGTVKLGEEITFKIKPREETISFDKYSFLQNVDYMTKKCSSGTCNSEKANYQAKSGYTVLKIDFASDNFEGKDMVDFSCSYGKINYIDNSKMEHSVEFKYPLNKNSLGKIIYTLVPEEVAKSESLEIVYIVRNEKYTYKLK